MTVHPAMRILCLLVLAAMIPWLPDIALFVTGLSLLAVGIAQPETGRAMRRGVKRIRWLLLSLLILYLWFTPGDPMLSVLGPLSPTETGMAQAIRRTGILLVLVFAATAFLGNVPPRRVAAALRQLLAWPVKTAPAMRFADRVGLLLEELPVTEQRLRARMEDRDGSIPARAAQLIQDVESGAARGTEPGSLPAPQALPRWQWLFPAGLLGAGLALVFLSSGG